jgi:chromosome segregation ATPase
LKSNTKTSNLSFSELKKQHQLLLKEVESLKNKLSENEEQHKKSLQESLGKLEDSELTYRLLQEELARKENDIKDRDETIKELKSQLDSVSFDKLGNAHS